MHLERQPTDQDLVSQHPHRPDVHALGVLLPNQQLWRHVEGGPAECLPKVVGGVDCPAEITNFTNTLVSYDVLRLKIPVDHVAAMHEFHSLKNLSDNVCCFLLPEPSFPLELMEQMSIQARFQQQIEIVVLAEHSVHLDHVGMVEVELDNNLSG